ncbi:MAG: inositol monophosphatase, partial [Halobacteriaceae archaeon]
MPDNESKRVQLAVDAAKTGAEIALDAFRSDITIETKTGKTDVVTAIDRQVQQTLINEIKNEYPDDVFVGEEEDERKTVPETGAVWIIDPIDGTNNYVRQMRDWATAVATVVDGKTIGAANVLPALNDTYVVGPDEVTLNEKAITVSDRSDPETCTVAPTIWWDFEHRHEYANACKAIVERFGDLRRPGCAQAVLSMIAAGQLDGAITNVVVNPWDAIGGVSMVRRAGGKVTDIDGDPWEPQAKGLV